MGYTSHLDNFTEQNLPALAAIPDFIFNGPDLQFGEKLNCASEILTHGKADAPCLLGEGIAWNYAQVREKVNQIAHCLVEMGLVTGNRVLLRGGNSPLLACIWFATVKIGAVAVTTMPMLRHKELSEIMDKAQVQFALCDEALKDEFPALHTLYFDALEQRMMQQPTTFEAVETAAVETCVIAFTSGTTGKPKGTMHTHRDIISACRCWPQEVLQPNENDIFIGSPPLAFTFGLGGLLLFPLYYGAATVLLEKAAPLLLLQAINDFKATICLTAPTSYRAMALLNTPLPSLKKCVSAGEALPTATRKLWREATGLKIHDGIGSTELFHIFIASNPQNYKEGAVGKVVKGYEACILDELGKPLPKNTVGFLAIKGPTGCKYLADARQSNYVKNGWNITGDAFLEDEEGYFHFQARTDDMIISAGYNIGAPEVENALLLHPAVFECAVIGAPDEERGQIVKAFVVLHKDHSPSVQELQNFVKNTIAPYKYPRAIEFLESLPKTETGKLQRFKLRT